MITTNTIAILGKQMRDAQKNYFTLIGRARKTGLPNDYTAAKEMLELSKTLEKAFDTMVDEFLGVQKQLF